MSNELQSIWKDRVVMVTGAAGFKGAFLCHYLAELGARVIALTRRRTLRESAYSLLGVSDSVTAEAEVDVADGDALRSAISRYRPTDIFHLAAIAQVPICRSEPVRATNVNIVAPIQLLEICRDLNMHHAGEGGLVDRVCICSTDHVFGPSPSTIPTPEDHPVGWGGMYDTSKAAMEFMIRSMYAEFRDRGLPRVAVTRCSNVFGPGDVNARRAIPNFLRAAASNGVLPVLCTQTRRQFIHVSDATFGYIKVMTALDNISDETMNVAPPTFHFGLAADEYGLDCDTQHGAISIGDLAAHIVQRHGGRLPESPVVDHLPNENDYQTLCTQATRAALGWKPTVHFGPALDDLAAWYASSRHVFELVPSVDRLQRDCAPETTKPTLRAVA